ncbi:MAG: hypothetical protein DWH78_12185 [Planctomycetota bacterium]|jgi:hypothetical protein|nr:MAG: hypothetical protein DWH78_12185 [Planctomycetota bacterium]
MNDRPQYFAFPVFCIPSFRAIRVRLISHQPVILTYLEIRHKHRILDVAESVAAIYIVRLFAFISVRQPAEANSER